MPSEPLKINLAEKFASFDDIWSPKIVASLGGYAVKAVKIAGEFVWHDHASDDELFYILRGAIRMEYRQNAVQRDVRFGPGEMLLVPAGLEHRPVADENTEILIFEREAIVNTGAISDPEFTHAATRI